VPLLVPHLAALDLFVDQAEVSVAGARNARDFIWMHRRQPYDLTVYQLGNARCHHYMWSYLFRYPGLVVLHDAQLHQARALGLLTERVEPRRSDYVAEFHANHPDAPPAVAELIASGLGGTLYAHWPFVRLVLHAARLTAVHNARVRDRLREEYPGVAIESLEMGVREPGRDEIGAVRQRHGIPKDAIIVAAVGAITPEKRIDAVVSAVAAVADRLPRVHLVLVGTPVDHYDVESAVRQAGIESRVHIAGFVDDHSLDDYLAAADICACLRWPTNRETSASWLRCLAASKPTIITDLAHLSDLPTIEPVQWALRNAGPDQDPIAVGIDVLDEERGLARAFLRLAADEGLRRQIGAAAREWWRAHHRLESMAERYRTLVADAAHRPVPTPSLPDHLVADGSATARALIDAFDVRSRVADLLA
jgi:glycosyltransferase involved in cell wall biosynthesis